MADEKHNIENEQLALQVAQMFYKTFPICDTLRHELSWSHYRRLCGHWEFL